MKPNKGKCIMLEIVLLLQNGDLSDACAEAPLSVRVSLHVLLQVRIHKCKTSCFLFIRELHGPTLFNVTLAGFNVNSQDHIITIMLDVLVSLLNS